MNKLSESEIYWLWLYSVEGVGTAKFYEIIKYYEDAKNAYNNVADISKVILGVGEKISENLIKSANDDYIYSLLKKINVDDINITTLVSRDYPRTLAEIELPPPVLFYKGTIIEEIACGIVGSRKPTKNGYITAKKIAEEFANQGILVISGMAKGIDSAAHNGALEGGGKTVAVLGSGVDVIYPLENKKLYEQIIQNGAIISEFMPGSEPKKTNFPQRNRVVAGLSDALIAGEGNSKSGARITVDFALRQGKEVYTLLCDFNSVMSMLPKYLLESGASVVTTAKNVMEDMGWEIKNICKKPDIINKMLDLFQEEIYNLLLKQSFSAEEIANTLNKDIKDVNIALTMLELNGNISAQAGNKYIINT